MENGLKCAHMTPLARFQTVFRVGLGLSGWIRPSQSPPRGNAAAFSTGIAAINPATVVFDLTGSNSVAIQTGVQILLTFHGTIIRC